jgi:hypothetical protein
LELNPALLDKKQIPIVEKEKITSPDRFMRGGPIESGKDRISLGEFNKILGTFLCSHRGLLAHLVVV